MISNKNKEKKEVVKEIENDDTPLDDKGNPVGKTTEVTLEDLLAKDPTQLTAAEMDILSANKDELTDEQKVAVGLMDAKDLEEEEEEEEEEPEKPKVVVKSKTLTPEEIKAEEEKKYKAQQAESQILSERNKAIQEKVLEADNLPEPTEDEIKEYVSKEGVDWEELTNFERSMAKKNLISERKLTLVTDGIRSQQKVDEWSGKIDTFIDSINDDPKYSKLSSHEAAFKKFAMQDSHRGADIEAILLPAFLYQLPTTSKTKRSIFEKGGGGERVERKEGITDAEYASKLRVSDPREYKRQVKAGKIKLEI